MRSPDPHQALHATLTIGALCSGPFGLSLQPLKIGGGAQHDNASKYNLPPCANIQEGGMLCTFALMSVCVCLLQHSRNFSMPHCEENLCKDVTFGIENIPSDQMRLNTSVGGKKCRWLTCVVSWHNVGRTGKEGGCSFSVRQSWVCCVYKKKHKRNMRSRLFFFPVTFLRGKKCQEVNALLEIDFFLSAVTKIN